MKITKSDFKIIFNKIINNSNDKNMKILQNLSNNSNSGDSQINDLVNTYSSEYISKIMNKILKNNLIGGETSEESKKNSSLLDLPLSETSIEPPKFINIIDMSAGAGDKDLPKTNNQRLKEDYYKGITSFFNIMSKKSPSSKSSSPVNSTTSSFLPIQPQSFSTTSTERSQTQVDSATSPLLPKLLKNKPYNLSSTSSRSSSPVNSTTSSFLPIQPQSFSTTSTERSQTPVDSATSPLSSMQQISTSPTSKSRWSLLRSKLKQRQQTPVDSATSPLSSMQQISTSPTSSEPSSFIGSQSLSSDQIIDNRRHNFNQILYEKEKLLEEKEKQIIDLQKLLAEIMRKK